MNLLRNILITKSFGKHLQAFKLVKFISPRQFQQSIKHPDDTKTKQMLFTTLLAPTWDPTGAQLGPFWRPVGTTYPNMCTLCKAFNYLQQVCLH